jgi:hypothetical protein
VPTKPALSAYDVGASDSQSSTAHLAQTSVISTGGDSGSTLRLRGLPFAAGVEDVRAFFAASGFELIELLICRRNGARCIWQRESAVLV